MLPLDAQDNAQWIISAIGGLLVIGLMVGLVIVVIGGIIEARGATFVCVPIGMLVVGLIGTAITGDVSGSVMVGAVIGLIASLVLAGLFAG